METMTRNTATPIADGPDEMEVAFAAFRRAYPTFASTSVLDDLRRRDYSRLDENGHIYLDYTGGSLYAESQLGKHMDLLKANVFGNPHSNNPTSIAMTDLVEGTRAYILRYFKASPAEYTVVFTPNASAALKLVGESYPFGPGGHYLLTFDNHNSVNGIREFARSRGAEVNYLRLTTPDLRIDRSHFSALLDKASPGHHNLFAYPAQSNFSGVQHPLELIGEAQEKGWDVLLDAAAFVPTNRLDLSRWQPDFVTISFYKIFGYPTGVGCLIARKEKLARLRRPWFAGGTIVLASVQAMAHHLAEDEAGFEDGTVNYLNIPAVQIGLEHIAKIGIETIHERVNCLTGWLLENLVALRHGNGKPLIRVFGPIDLHGRGGTVTFNIYDPQGRMVDYRRVEELAGRIRLSLRTGCFCNPGVAEIAEGVSDTDMLEGFKDDRRMPFPQFISLLEKTRGKSLGAVRISVGLVTNFSDVYRFLAFIQSFKDKSTEKVGNVEFDIESCRVTRDGS